MILSVTLNPCVDHTLFVDGLRPHDRNKVRRMETDAGGKGINLSRMVAELGGATTATGFLGGDSGDFVAAVLKRQGVSIDFVEVAGETRTNMAVESGDGPPTVFSAPGLEVTGLEWENMLAKVNELASRSEWVAIGGSLPPGLPVETYKMLVGLAKTCGARVLLDADGEALVHGLEAGPDMVKPNLDEARRLLGTDIRCVRDAVEAAKALRARLVGSGSESPIAAVSLGSEGAALATDEGVLYGVSPRVETKSTIGSGDSFLGGFLVALEGGKTHAQALAAAMAAGAATAMTDGTRIGSARDAHRLEGEGKVLAEDELSRLGDGALAAWLKR